MFRRVDTPLASRTTIPTSVRDSETGGPNREERNCKKDQWGSSLWGKKQNLNESGGHDPRGGRESHLGKRICCHGGGEVYGSDRNSGNESRGCTQNGISREVSTPGKPQGGLGGGGKKKRFWGGMRYKERKTDALGKQTL